MGLRHLSEIELTEYADGETAAEGLVEVERHLAACTDCAGAVSRIRQAAATSGRLSTTAAPANLRKRVAEALVREHGGGISCREAAPLLHEYIDHPLSPGAALLLSHHLDSCATCRAELAVLTSAARLVRAMPEVAAPGRVRERVLSEERRLSRAPARWNWRPAAATAVATLAAAVMLFRHAPEAAKAPVIAKVDGSSRSLASSPDARRPVSPVEPPRAVETAERPEEPTVEVAEVRPEPAVVRPAVLVGTPEGAPKGPSTAPVVMETTTPRVAMPAGLRALRVVARNASDVEVPQAMQMAGERYATLRSEALSEAMLVRSTASEPLREDGDIGEQESSPTAPKHDTAAPDASVSPQPAREGAMVLGRPIA